MSIGARRSYAFVPVGRMADRECLLGGAWSASTYLAMMGQQAAAMVVLTVALSWCLLFSFDSSPLVISQFRFRYFRSSDALSTAAM
jgi:hypothetical protein